MLHVIAMDSWNNCGFKKTNSTGDDAGKMKTSLQWFCGIQTESAGHPAASHGMPRGTVAHTAASPGLLVSPGLTWPQKRRVLHKMRQTEQSRKMRHSCSRDSFGCYFEDLLSWLWSVKTGPLHLQSKVFITFITWVSYQTFGTLVKLLKHLKGYQSVLLRNWQRRVHSTTKIF